VKQLVIDDLRFQIGGLQVPDAVLQEDGDEPHQFHRGQADYSARILVGLTRISTL